MVNWILARGKGDFVYGGARILSTLSLKCGILNGNYQVEAAGEVMN